MEEALRRRTAEGRGCAETMKGVLSILLVKQTMFVCLDLLKTPGDNLIKV